MLSIDKNSFKRDYENKFVQLHGKELKEGTNQQKYEALGSLVRDYVTNMWIETNKEYREEELKQVYYFSMEFLLGKLLEDYLLNLGIHDICKEALEELNIDLNQIVNLEQDQGLGNGGLGRLAACFLDSMASLNIPGNGCGIRYKYGFFEQKIVDGKQVEVSDNWLREGNVWERKKADKSEIVKFGGTVKVEELAGKMTFTHVNYEPVLAVPYDTPIVGFQNDVVNTLRLWSAEPVSNEFDYSSFSRGEFLKAISYKNSVEAISLVLYPEDSFYEGKMLRLKQQYFFVCAGLQSIIRRFKRIGGDIYELDEKIDLVIDQLLERMEIQGNKRVKNFPFLMGQGIWRGSDNLSPEDTLKEVIKQGTLTVGFIGLAECLIALTGKHHGESEDAQELGLKIVSHMRKRIDEATEKYKLNFSLIATPAEGLSGRFTEIDKKIYGEITGITDKEYYTNSFHVPVYYNISAFNKIKIEAPYHELTNGGHITYVELDGDTSNNLQAFETIIRSMKEMGIGYGSVNHPVDRDPVCGFSGVIPGTVCPVCGRNEEESDIKFERIRRITGYLVGTVDRFNDAKKAEVRDRVKHTRI